MRKVLACALSLVVGLALLQLSGCKKSDPVVAAAKKLVGVWKGKPPAQDASKKGQPEPDVTVEFKDGGALSMDVVLFTMKGTWEVLKAEGNNVSIKTVLEMPDLGALMGKEKNAKPTKETKDFAIVFLTDDRITMAPTDQPKEIATLNRQKK